MHLLSHFKADPIRTAANKPHGIFTPMARNNVYQLVDDIVVNWNTLAKVPAGNGMWNIQMGDFIGNADNISGLPVRNVAQGYQPTKWVQFICKGGNPINVTTLYPVIP